MKGYTINSKRANMNNHDSMFANCMYLCWEICITDGVLGATKEEYI